MSKISAFQKRLRTLLWSKRLLPIKNLVYYPLRRVLNGYHIRKVARGKPDPVVVYQMGKVASKTVEYAIRRCTNLPVFHAHLVSPENMERRRPEFEKKFGRSYTDYYFAYGRTLYDQLFRSTRRVRIITLLREPIGRNVSAYFQDLDYIWEQLDAYKHVPLGDLMEGFRNRYNHTASTRWFEDEFYPATGIDVYAVPFPHARGYLAWTLGKYDVLIMRHDLPDEQKERAVNEFLGTTVVRIENENTASDKGYKDIYRKFVSELQLSAGYVDSMLGSRYARHFYSDDERERIRARWLHEKS